jgi:hypothetical protein
MSLKKKKQDRKVKQFLFGDWYQWDRGGYKEKVYVRNTVAWP